MSAAWQVLAKKPTTRPPRKTGVTTVMSLIWPARHPRVVGEQHVAGLERLRRVGREEVPHARWPSR